MIAGTARRVARFGWLILLVLCLQPGETLPALAQSAEAYGLVDAVNAYRESVGLPRLMTSGALMVAAQRHAEWMAASYTYSHTGEGGSSPQDRARAAGFSGSVGENVAGSTEATPAEAVFFWDQSYAHRITMRQPLATHIGGGFAANSQQRLFVLLIGAASGQAPQPTTQPIAGGTPVIGYTPPPGMVWSTNGQMHQGSDYNPVAPAGGQQSVNVVAQSAPTEVAYVMPYDLIRIAEPQADGSVVHVVEPGQTAWAIAARYGVDLGAMLAINHLSENAVLRPGDKLIIRLGEGQSPPPAPTTPSTHQVRSGESLWNIAARYNRSVDELRAWNDLPADAVIQPGDVLVIAPPTPMPTATLMPTTTPPAIPSSIPAASPSPSLTETLTETPPTATSETATITPMPLQGNVVQPTPPVLKEVAEGAAAQAKDAAVRLLIMLGATAFMVAVIGGASLVWLVRKQSLPPFSGDDARSDDAR